MYYIRSKYCALWEKNTHTQKNVLTKFSVKESSKGRLLGGNVET